MHHKRALLLLCKYRCERQCNTRAAAPLGSNATVRAWRQEGIHEPGLSFIRDMETEYYLQEDYEHLCLQDRR
jgi:hypothetical protein